MPVTKVPEEEKVQDTGPPQDDVPREQSPESTHPEEAPEDQGNQQPQGEASPEKYSAQVLRRMHEDAEILLQEYDEMAEYLEHDEIKNFVHQDCAMIAQKLSAIESLFQSHHPDYEQPGTPPPEQTMQEQQGMNQPPEQEAQQAPEEYAQEGEEATSSQRPLPSEDDAVQGMRKKSLEGWVSYCQKKGLCPECKNSPCVCGKKDINIGRAGRHHVYEAVPDKMDVDYQNSQGNKRDEQGRKLKPGRAVRGRMDSSVMDPQDVPTGVQATAIGLAQQHGKPGNVRIHDRTGQNLIDDSTREAANREKSLPISVVRMEKGYTPAIAGRYFKDGTLFKSVEEAVLHGEKMFFDDSYMKALGFQIEYKQVPGNEEDDKEGTPYTDWTPGVTPGNEELIQNDQGVSGDQLPGVRPGDEESQEKLGEQAEDGSLLPYLLPRHHHANVQQAQKDLLSVANKSEGEGLTNEDRMKMYHWHKCMEGCVKDMVGDDTSHLDNIDHAEGMKMFVGDWNWLQSEAKEKEHKGEKAYGVSTNRAAPLAPGEVPQAPAPAPVKPPPIRPNSMRTKSGEATTKEDSLQIQEKRIGHHHVKVLHHAGKFFKKLANEKAFGLNDRQNAYLLGKAMDQIASDDPIEEMLDQSNVTHPNANQEQAPESSALGNEEHASQAPGSWDETRHQKDINEGDGEDSGDVEMKSLQQTFINQHRQLESLVKALSNGAH